MRTRPQTSFFATLESSLDEITLYTPYVPKRCGGTISLTLPFIRTILNPPVARYLEPYQGNHPQA